MSFSNAGTSIKGDSPFGPSFVAPEMIAFCASMYSVIKAALRRRYRALRNEQFVAAAEAGVWYLTGKILGISDDAVVELLAVELGF